MSFRCLGNSLQFPLKAQVNTMGRNGGVSETAQIGLIGISSCVLIGISYDLRTFGIPKAFSDGIRL
jgi:hypothetical protein